MCLLQLQTDVFECTIFRVQFGNISIPKIPLTAKLAVLGVFFIQLFPNWTACSPITYTYFILYLQSSFGKFFKHDLTFHFVTQAHG